MGQMVSTVDKCGLRRGGARTPLLTKEGRGGGFIKHKTALKGRLVFYRPTAMLMLLSPLPEDRSSFLLLCG